MATLSSEISATSAAPAVIIPTYDLTLSYAQLTKAIRTFQASLAAVGITAQSAVSIALPNTLEFIVSFLAVGAQRSIAAPLNPNYKQGEFEFYIDDLKSKLIIVPPGAVKADAPAVRAARKFGAAVAEVHWDGKKGEVVLDLKENNKLDVKNVELVQAQPDDIALVLHTSGTTGRPKAVPLTHRNLTRTMRKLKRILSR